MREKWRPGSSHRMAAPVALLFIARALSAQQVPASDTVASYPSFKLAARLHFQGYFFDNTDYVAAGLGNPGPKSSFHTRRARIEITGKLSQYVSFVVQPSFENGAGREPNLRLRDAFIELGLGQFQLPSLKLRFGQEKRPFGRYELLSANNLPSIERGAGRGLLAQGSNNLFERSGFLSHDVGVSVMAKVGAKSTAQAGVYNGTGESFNDTNNAKSFGLRVTSAVASKLNLGASYFSHDGVMAQPQLAPASPNTPDSSFRNNAFGFDGSWGRPGNSGFFAVADYMRGEAFTTASPTISGLSIVTAYQFRLASPQSHLYAIEPALRFDHADPDSDAKDDASTLVTAVLGLYLNSTTVLRVAYERQDFEGGGPMVAGVRMAMNVSF
ncbi:MAG: OprO/OprP family phosphate-selective porin [Gemmatimonadota bacterium]|nr:OprO/OprP family phosphate-selective porin [Gemmatimonadota bacterium]